MDNQLFRKKSLERISSPEEMHDYMRVTSPRLWMILGAIVVLVVGFIVYASTTTMENTVKIRVTVENYVSTPEDGQEAEKYTYVSAELPLDVGNSVATGMEIRLGKETGKVAWIGQSAGENSLYVQFEMEHQYFQIPDGEQEAELVLESTTPISFLWNN